MEQNEKTEYPESAYLKAEEKYMETADIRYAVLAIGRYIANPPVWALKACEDFFQKAQKANFAEYSENAKKTRYPNDYDSLEQMADLIAAGKSTHGAAVQVSKDQVGGSNIKRLTRKYNDEKYIDGLGEENAPPRLDRAIEKRVKSGKWGTDE